MSVERVGGEEPETVTLWRFCLEPECAPARWRSSVRIPHPAEYSMETETCEFVPLSALRLVEEELRQAREVAHSRLRDRARLVRRAERAEADLDLLIRRFALVSARSGMRAQALQLAEECITENLANGEGVDSQPAVLDAIFDALKYEITDEPDSARPGAKSPIQSAPVSPVQGEHEQDGGGSTATDRVTVIDGEAGAQYTYEPGPQGHRPVARTVEGSDGALRDYAEDGTLIGTERLSPGEHGQDGEDGENAAVWRGEPVFVGDKNFAQWLKEHRDSHARMGSTTPCVCAGCEWARAQDGDHNEKEQGR